VEDPQETRRTINQTSPAIRGAIETYSCPERLSAGRSKTKSGQKQHEKKERRKANGVETLVSPKRCAEKEKQEIND